MNIKPVFPILLISIAIVMISSQNISHAKRFANGTSDVDKDEIIRVMSIVHQDSLTGELIIRNNAEMVNTLITCLSDDKHPARGYAMNILFRAVEQMVIPRDILKVDVYPAVYKVLEKEKKKKNKTMIQDINSLLRTVDWYIHLDTPDQHKRLSSLYDGLLSAYPVQNLMSANILMTAGGDSALMVLKSARNIRKKQRRRSNTQRIENIIEEIQMNKKLESLNNEDKVSYLLDKYNTHSKGRYSAGKKEMVLRIIKRIEKIGDEEAVNVLLKIWNDRKDTKKTYRYASQKSLLKMGIDLPAKKLMIVE